MSYEPNLLQRIIEGALLAAGDALSIERMLSLFEEAERPEKPEVLAALAALQESCSGRGYDLVEVASGWRFQVAPDLAPWVNRLWEEKPQKYSRALLETLSLIAYRQPITRSDIEDVRGVAVSSHIIKTLAEREWIKVVGHRDVPGRPALYATTRQFLDYFGLKSLDELPSLGELQDIDSLNRNLELMDDEMQVEREQIAAARDEPATSSLFDEDEANETGSNTQSAESDAGSETSFAASEIQPLKNDAQPAGVSAQEAAAPAVAYSDSIGASGDGVAENRKAPPPKSLFDSPASLFDATDSPPNAETGARGDTDPPDSPEDPPESERNNSV